MGQYELILKEITDYINKCAKPKSSSNLYQELPWDFDLEYDVEDYMFSENDPYGNMFTNIAKKQAELQENNADFSELEENWLEDYFHNGYQWVNGLIYDSDSFYMNFSSKLIRQYKAKLDSAKHNLDKAISKSVPLQQNTKLYTKIRIDDSLEIGEIGQWKGYVSTSFDKGSTFSSGSSDYKVTILALEGVKGVCANAKAKYQNNQNDGFSTLSIHPSENEYLLGRNTRYMVLEKDPKLRTAKVLVF